MKPLIEGHVKSRRIAWLRKRLIDEPEEEIVGNSEEESGVAYQV